MRLNIKQLIRFGVVGTVVFLVDYFVLWLFTEIFGIWYLASSVCAFVISLIVNYCLSMKYVFMIRQDKQKAYQFIAFSVMSGIGLIVNTFLLWILVDLAEIHYLISKLFVTVIVLVYNYISRKIYFEKSR